MRAKSCVVALVSGFIMAVGLAIGRLTRPEVIIGWVDFFGNWDPTMLVFFVTAVAVYHPMLRWAQASERSGSGPRLCLPTARTIDAKLLGGSVIFGVGWALGGVCPGPALTSLGAGARWTAAFVVAMAAGLIIGDFAVREARTALDQSTGGRT